MFQIINLTRFNALALSELLTDEEKTRVTVGKTTAAFDMEPDEALRLLAELRQQRANATQHRSLFAVIRKVRAARHG